MADNTAITIIDEDRDFEFAVTAKLRHGALWKLVQKFGSQAALAKHLGVRATALGRLINMKGKPPFKAAWWPRVCDELLVLTGQTVDELFPGWMSSEDFLNLPKNNCEFKRLSASRLMSVCAESRTALPEASAALTAALKTLPAREQLILSLRFGLGASGNSRTYTLQQVGDQLGVTRERIRELEARAIRKLQRPMQLIALRDAAEADGLIGFTSDG